MSFLIRIGADSNLQNKNGTTGLMYATWAGNANIVEVLLRVGANPHVTDQCQHTALGLAVFKFRTLKDSSNTEYYLSWVEITKMLVAAGADVDIPVVEQRRRKKINKTVYQYAWSLGTQKPLFFAIKEGMMSYKEAISPKLLSALVLGVPDIIFDYLGLLSHTQCQAS